MLAVIGVLTIVVGLIAAAMIGMPEQKFTLGSASSRFHSLPLAIGLAASSIVSGVLMLAGSTALHCLARIEAAK